jgi:hypothetical protein
VGRCDRLNAIRHVLGRVDYGGKSPEAIGQVDERIIGSGRAFQLST